MAKNSTTDIELLAGLSIDSSEQEILRAIKIIQKRIKANTDARFKLNVEIDETVINNTIAKLQNALKNKNLKIETQDSITAITKEANAMLEVVEAAKRASQEKLEFEKANRQVESSARATADAINRERTAMNNLDDLDSILQNVNMTGRQGASVFQSFGDSLRNAMGTYTMANLLHEGLEKVVEAGKEAIEITKKFNDINVNLQMATGEDKDYVKGLIDDYAELGGELGALTETVAESADTFLRQGRSMEETNQLIRDAVVLSKVAQTEGEKASEILTATINGFQLAASEGSRVNDVLSSIDLNSASSAEGIGEALTKTASMAHNAGVSLEKTAAMIATIKDVTQDADTTIGTSLKTVLSRMNSIRAGKFIDEESGEALNDVEKVLGAISVSMRDVNGQFKEAEAIIDEVGTKWKTLDGNTQKAVTTAMGGVYQANKLTALFDNYDKVIELTKVAEESTGTALQKFNDSYLPSLEAKTNALRSSLEALATSTISDEFYGSVLDTTKSIVDMTTETGILKGALAGLATSGAIYAFEHLTTYLHDATQEFANLGEAMQITRGANGTITDIQRLIDLTGGLSESQTRLLLNTRNLTDAQRTAILMNQYLAQGMDDDLARATAEATLQTWGLTTAQQGATGAAITLRNTLRGLWASLLANPLVLVTAAVTAGVTAFTHYKQEQEEAIRATKQSAEESAELSEELSDLVSRYVSLSDAVKDDESAKEDLMSVQDDLIKKLGLESDNLDTLIEKYGTLDEAIKNATLSKLHEARHDLVSGYDVAVDELLDAGADKLYKNQWTVYNKQNKEALEILNKKGIGRVTDDYVGDTFYLTGVDSTIEGVLKNYQQLGDALSALEEAYGAENVTDIGLYNDLYARYNELKSFIASYQESVDELNENAASSLQLTMLKEVEFPDTSEEIEAFKQDMLEAALASKNFVGTQEDIERAVDSVIDSLTSYSGAESVLDSGIENNVDSIFAMSDKQAEAYEKYKSLISDISKVYTDYENLSKTDIMNMFKDSGYDFANFMNGTENLDTTMHKLANNGLKEVKTAFEGMEDAEQIILDLEQATLGLLSNAFGWSENVGHINTLENLLTEIQKGKPLEQQIADEIAKTYDLDFKALGDGYTFDEKEVKSLLDDYAKDYNESLAKFRVFMRDAMGLPDEYIDNFFGKYTYRVTFDDSDNSSSKKSESLHDFTEQIDWYAQSVDILSDRLSDLETQLDNTKGYDAQIAKIDEVITAQENLKGAYEESHKGYIGQFNDLLYSDEVKSLGLDPTKLGYMITSGQYSGIEDYEGEVKEEAYDVIQELIDWFNKALEADNNAVKIGVDIDANELQKLEIYAEQQTAERELLDTELESAKTLEKKLEIYEKLPDTISDEYNANIAVANENGDINEALRLQLELEQLLFQTEQDRLDMIAEYASIAKDLAFDKLDSPLSDKQMFNAIADARTLTNDYYQKEIASETNKYGADSTQVQSLYLQWQKELLDLKERELELNREIEDSEVTKLEQARAQLENQIDINGGEGTGEQYQELIKNEKLIIKELTGDLDREGKLLLEIESTLGKNSSEYRTQEQVVNDIANEIDECVKRTKKWGAEILNLGLDVVQDKIDGLSDQLEDVEDALKEWDAIIAGAQAYIQDQIDAQEELKKPIEEQLETMEKANDERERALALDKARYELERARSQRTVKLYSGEEKGFIYTQNQDNIREAQENLADLEYEEAVHQLEKQLEYYDEIIEDLQEIKDAWGAVKQNAQDALDIEKAITAIGIDGIMNMSVVEDVTNSYTELLRAQESLTAQIGELQDLFELLQRIVAEYQFGYTTLQEATEKMHEAVYNFYGDYNDQGLSTTTERQELIDRIKKAQGMGSTIEDLIGRVQGAVDRFAETDYSGAENTMNEIVNLVEDFYNEIYGSIEDVNFEGLITNMEPLQNFLSDLEWGQWNSYAFEPEYYSGLISALATVNPEFANMISSAEEASKALEESGEGVAEGADAYATLEEKVDGLLGKLEELSKATYVTDFSETQLSQLEGFTFGMETAFSTMSTNITNTISGVFSDFQTQLSGVLSAINTTMSSISDSVGKIKTMQAEISGIASDISNTYSSIQTTVEEASKLQIQLGKPINKDTTQNADSNSSNSNIETKNTNIESDGDIVINTRQNKPNPKSNYKFEKIDEYHTGLENGLVGEKDVSDGIKELGLRKLRPNEVPALLKVNEAVLTEAQQKLIMDNFGMAYKAGVNSSLNNIVPRNNNTTPVVQNVTVNCPNLTGESGFNEFKRQLDGLQLKAIQYANRR